MVVCVAAVHGVHFEYKFGAFWSVLLKGFYDVINKCFNGLVVGAFGDLAIAVDLERHKIEFT